MLLYVFIKGREEGKPSVLSSGPDLVSLLQYFCQVSLHFHVLVDSCAEFVDLAPYYFLECHVLVKDVPWVSRQILCGKAPQERI